MRRRIAIAAIAAIGLTGCGHQQTAAEKRCVNLMSGHTLGTSSAAKVVAKVWDESTTQGRQSLIAACLRHPPTTT